MTTLLNNTVTPDDTKAAVGVPGFSDRINVLFDLAKAPTDKRLTWGAERWDVVPNTVRNWTKLNTPPKNFASLELVVDDLLQLSGSSASRSAVIGWLYSGANKPQLTATEDGKATKISEINHSLQVKIFNLIFKLCGENKIDFSSISEQKLNGIISRAYAQMLEAGSTDVETIKAHIMQRELASLIEPI